MERAEMKRRLEECVRATAMAQLSTEHCRGLTDEAVAVLDPRFHAMLLEMEEVFDRAVLYCRAQVEEMDRRRRA